MPPAARAYIEELLPDVLEGRLEPGRVFDRTVTLEEVPDPAVAIGQDAVDDGQGHRHPRDLHGNVPEDFDWRDHVDFGCLSEVQEELLPPEAVGEEGP